MKLTWKKTAAAVLVGMMALAAAGCGGGDKKADKAAVKDNFKFGMTNFADTLEPTTTTVSWMVLRLGLGETLAKFGSDLSVQPWLAESWKISDDKLTWTIKINDKAVFSNGNKVTAAAVKGAFERTFKMSARAGTFFKVAEMKADGQILTIKTQQPCPSLPGMLCDPLFVVYDTSVKDRNYQTEGPICTGPYKVKTYTKAKASMERNEKYWNGEVPFKTVEALTIDDPNARAMALQKGELDAIINVGAGDMALFNDTKKYTISEIASMRTVLAQINQNKGLPMADPKVRAALIQCLNRETYNKVLLKDRFIPGKAPVPPSLDFGFDQIKDPNQYNVENAKKLLAEAGWKDTNGDGFVDKDGKNLEIDFLIYPGRAELPLYAEATQADAKNIGIKVNIKSMDYNAFEPKRSTGEYGLMISNILTANTGDPEIYLDWYWKTNKNGSQPLNASGYSNAEFDKLSDQAKVEFDPAKRREIFIKMQQILVNDGAAIFFGYPKTNMVSRANIENANIYPADYYWITKDIKVKK